MASFMQTQQWAEFQKALGADYFKIGAIFVLKYNLPFNKHYFYIPRADFNAENLKNIITKIPTANSVFLRTEPETEINKNSLSEILINLDFKKIKRESQPSKTLILNLEKSEKEILDAMHYKTRYNIRVAEKNGVKIEIKKSLNNEEFEQIWDLTRKTAKRDKFSIFPKEYYKKLLTIFNITSQKEDIGFPKPYIKTILARNEKKIIAEAIIMFCNDTATYLHGASDYEFRNLMAPHLIQWSAILEAKKSGCQFYDFWGIDAKKWPGVTRFKNGFGGREIEYAGTWDYVFDKKWYYMYLLTKKLKHALNSKQNDTSFTKLYKKDYAKKSI